MCKSKSEDIFVYVLNEDELKEQNGGQYFKPSIDGSFLTDSNITANFLIEPNVTASSYCTCLSGR